MTLLCRSAALPDYLRCKITGLSWISIWCQRLRLGWWQQRRTGGSRCTCRLWQRPQDILPIASEQAAWSSLTQICQWCSLKHYLFHHRILSTTLKFPRTLWPLVRGNSGLAQRYNGCNINASYQRKILIFWRWRCRRPTNHTESLRNATNSGPDNRRQVDQFLV